jgi:hypothetical protein
MKSILLIFFTLLLVSGCAGLSTDRSFIDEMDYETEGLFVPGRDFSVVPGDSGEAFRTREEISLRTPYSGREGESRMEEVSIRKELRSKERRLTSMGRQQYREAIPYLETASERIYFLNLSPYERDDYIRTREVRPAGRSLGRGVASVSSSLPGRDWSPRGIEIGMNKSSVVSLWGRPERVDVAGNPTNENERWTFLDGSGARRHVYFEKGAVQGWNAR